MSYFISEEEIYFNKTFTIKGQEARHILQSRRLGENDYILVQDGNQKRYKAKIIERLRNQLVLQPVEEIILIDETNLEINLFQALIKEKSLDNLLQKTTELGVSNIYIFHSRYSQRILKSHDLETKIQRWKKIALEACKQSDRQSPPEIVFIDFLNHCRNEAVNRKLKHNLNLILATDGEKQNLKAIKDDNQDINLLIGPEGGWADVDLSDLINYKIKTGPRILRSDTAAIVAVSLVQYLFGDMGF